MRTLLEREFIVSADLDACWNHLAKIEAWPTWARHIRSIDVSPEGPLSASTEGLIRLRNGVRSHFRMTELVPRDRWVWAGKFAWLRVRYFHGFTSCDAGRTSLRFRVDVDGFATGSLGRLFAGVYARSLDRAIPNLIAELEAL